MYKYRASIVMAVYNVEPFVREAIDSVIGQDIGFENIQLILVDDGSTDGSGAICDEYKKQYPDNVIVLHKENGGVSSARNEGLKYIQGQYVNFMDADDKLSSNTVTEICNFFAEHNAETDVVAFPMFFFDGRKGQHTLNYKFNKGNRVIDLDKEWQNPQLSMSSAFVKAECMSAFCFDMRLAYYEDAQVMQKILSNKCTLGVINTTKYWYRRRSIGESSAVQSANMREERYMPCMVYFQQEIINYYLLKYQYVPRFIQFILMYDLQWRINQIEIPKGVLSQADESAYYSAIRDTLKFIDDDVILAQRNIYREHKFFAFNLKYEGIPKPFQRDTDLIFAFSGGAVFKMSECPTALEFIKQTNDGILLEGVVSIPTYSWSSIKVFIRSNETLFQCVTNSKTLSTLALGREIQRGFTFKANIPLDKTCENIIDIVLNIDGINIPLKNVNYRQFFPLTAKYQNSYANIGNWIVQKNPRGFKVTSNEITSPSEHEKLFCRELWQKNNKGGRNAVFARCISRLLCKLKQRPIWLISDRASKAGDNGEALFQYMREYHPEIDCFFVINGKCPDYKRLKKIGPVIAKDSRKHKTLLLISDLNISSHVEIDIYNPFYKYGDAYQDIITSQRFIFLQHGVTKDDLSDWLCRRKKNLSGFVTAARPEYQSIINGNYDYTGKQVWLTGFPRFDRLYSDDKKVIAIVPTWRKYLMGKLDKHTGIWSLAPGFKESSYYKFYDALINDFRLLDALTRHGYTLAFFPHPNMQAHIDQFTKKPYVKFLGAETEYRDLYAQCSLILTDYSSVVFDFAYLRKPVLYMHFDTEEFFAGDHSYQKGYFDYERDGFGEVEYNLEGTVNRIIEYVENDCQLKEKYRERIDNFFAFNDQNNCQRVFEKIMELDQTP